MRTYPHKIAEIISWFIPSRKNRHHFLEKHDQRELEKQRIEREKEEERKRQEEERKRQEEERKRQEILKGFDAEYYLKQYPDVKSAGVDPKEHYFAYGRFEGRGKNEKEGETFYGLNEGWYLQRYPDVKELGVDAKKHYITIGKAEGRFRNEREEVLNNLKTHCASQYYIQEAIDDIPFDFKRAIVFAGYTGNGKLEENTYLYLEELKRNSDYIIAIFDNYLLEDEIQKLRQIVDSFVCRPHGEYDFGSYKKGFDLLNTIGVLEKVEYLVFCNDSVKYVGDSLKPVLEKSVGKDFWGITQHYYGFRKDSVSGNYDWVYTPHVQSYFFSVSSKIFMQSFFRCFMYSIRKEHNKLDIIEKYEEGLSKLIKENGYHLSSYYPYSLEKIDLCGIYQIESFPGQIFQKEKYFRGERIF